MPIITKAIVKDLLQVNHRLWDNQIDTWIPKLQKLVIDQCNNYFLNQDFSYSASTISFSGTTISDSDSGFDDLVAGEYRVRNSKRNDGIVTVTVVADGALTTSETLVTEAAENEIFLTKVEFPEEIQPAFADLVKAYITGKEKKEAWDAIKREFKRPYK